VTHDAELLPRRFPRRPDPDLSLRVARLRAEVAVLAIKEALGDPERREAGRKLALENLVKAVKALRR